MYLIKDIYGNYFNAEYVNCLKVQDDSTSYCGRYNIVAFDVECNEFHISQHDTKAEAKRYMDALANTIMKHTSAARR